jgi:hypothetical protein
MRHQFEYQSPADAEDRAAAAIRGAIASFDQMSQTRLDESARSVLAEFIVDALVEAGFLPAAPPGRPGPFT